MLDQRRLVVYNSTFILDLVEELTSLAAVVEQAVEDEEEEVVVEEEERRNLPHLLKNLIKNWIPT